MSLPRRPGGKILTIYCPITVPYEKPQSVTRMRIDLIEAKWCDLTVDTLVFAFNESGKVVDVSHNELRACAI